MWNWIDMPGKQDFHDAMAQCYALAAFFGMGTGAKLVKKYTETRRAKGPIGGMLL